MKTIIIRLGYDATLALPQDMPKKDVQALVGFLATLHKVERVHNFDEGSENMWVIKQCPSIQLEEVELTDPGLAQKIYDESLTRYRKREEEEKQQKAAAQS